MTWFNSRVRSNGPGLCLLSVLAAIGCARPPGPPARVVVVVIDTLRADHLPPYGYGLDTAPFLSQLAREGVLFEHAYSPASWTAPATASLFTSLYPFQHGVVLGLRATRKLRSIDERVRLHTLPEELETMPEAMKRAGYATFGLTHNLNVSKPMGFAQGFDRFWHSPSQDSAADLNARLMEWKDRLATSPRTFLYLHYLDPHSPYHERAPLFDENTSGRARTISAYDSEIRFVDQHLRAAYDAFGWGRDTLLVVTADHGEEFWEHGDIGHGHSLFGEVLNIPLIVRFPDGRWGGRRVGAPVSLLDVLPTLRECVGQPPRGARRGAKPDAPGARPPDRLRAHPLRASVPPGRHGETSLGPEGGAAQGPQGGDGPPGRAAPLRPRDRSPRSGGPGQG